MIRDIAWRAVARMVTMPVVTDWLIARAQRTPYTHITSRDGSDVYMGRWWLFNPYSKDADGDPAPARWPWLPSIRVHWIRRPDNDRHLHDHPWNARTIVLRGWYLEELPQGAPDAVWLGGKTCWRWRERGNTGRLLFGEYHRINAVSQDGVWTLFFTWRKRGTWGFDVDGVKVPWRRYLGLQR